VGPGTVSRISRNLEAEAIVDVERSEVVRYKGLMRWSRYDVRVISF
jgi:hypothetical protein